MQQASVEINSTSFVVAKKDDKRIAPFCVWWNIELQNPQVYSIVLEDC